jgi:hypothetical protein
MRRLFLATMLVGTLLAVGCNSISSDETQLEDVSETINDTQSAEDSTSDTDLTTAESLEDTSTSDETLSDTDTTSTDDTDSTAVEDTSATEADSQNPNEDTTSTESTASEETYNMPIPTSCESSYITQEMCAEISQYFQSMVDVDVDTFQSKQLSAYNTFMSDYLSENDSSLEDMLSTYCDNFLKSNGDEDSAYTDFTLDSITLEYPNDVDSILNTMNYIDQLDEVTSEQEGYVLSTSLTAYYQLNYTIDYTLTADSLEDYTSTKSGSVLVLDVDGDISLVMLS